MRLSANVRSANATDDEMNKSRVRQRDYNENMNIQGDGFVKGPMSISTLGGNYDTPSMMNPMSNHDGVDLSKMN